jgi:plastocyanin
MIVLTESFNVSIKNFVFNPSAINITKGDTVTWTNEDSNPHTVTANAGVFNSGTLNPGQSFSYKFEQAGEFDYHCNFHPSMQGKIIVK